MAQLAGTAPTKGNLLSVRKSLGLSSLGFELLDKKRNILIREAVALTERANALRGEISSTFAEAYTALKQANIALGVVADIVKSIPVDDGVSVSYRSVMGVDIPIVKYEEMTNGFFYGVRSTNSSFDKAYIGFVKAKRLIAELAEVENCVFRLCDAIRRTQRRANALENIIIPNFKETEKFISDSLEEKDREEFSRLKVIKKRKQEN